MPLQLILGDKNPEMIAAWEKFFAGLANVEIRGGNLLMAKADALVSPANSFGFMDGGIDWSISDLFEWKIQSVVQEMINEKPAGELVVGAADVVPTGHERFKFLICAPTMRTPSNAAATVKWSNASRPLRAPNESGIRQCSRTERSVQNFVGGSNRGDVAQELLNSIRHFVFASMARARASSLAACSLLRIEVRRSA